MIGVINPSLFAIGDTLSITGGFNFKPLPQFQPELFAKIYPKDVGKRKAFDKGVLQLTDEGAIQRLQSYEREADYIFAAVGQLQFEVMQYRLRDEYGAETVLSMLPYHCSAWVIGDLKQFEKSSNALLVKDRHERPIILFTSQWEKQYCMKQNPNLEFLDVLV